MLKRRFFQAGMYLLINNMLNNNNDNDNNNSNNNKNKNT